MRNPILLCFLVLLSCIGNENNSEKNLKSEKKQPSARILSSPKPDSNYVNYWCSTAILSETEQNLKKLDIVLVANFLATFHRHCREDKEYAKRSNTLLFKVLKRKPDIFLQLLSKNDSLQRDFILEELGNPSSFYADLHAIIQCVKDTNANTPEIEDWKIKVVQSLEKANTVNQRMKEKK